MVPEDRIFKTVKKKCNILHNNNNNNIIEPKIYFILWINSVDGPKSYGPVTLTTLCTSNCKLKTSKHTSKQVCSQVSNDSQQFRKISTHY